METRLVLIVGSILLCCGCAGLLIVRLSNPFFQGLGWLGGSFASGATGALALTQGDDHPYFYMAIAYTLILLAYVLFHICILELTEDKIRFPRLGLFLLSGQAVLFLGFPYFQHAREHCIETLGIVLAVQAIQSAVLLKRRARSGMLPPAWFNISLLVGFAAFNTFRSVAVLFLRVPLSPQAPSPFEVVTVVVYLGAGLGLGFGIFWMTSADIRHKLEKLANIDPLTELNNRRAFLSWCERELLVGLRTKRPFSLIFIDLDDFKRINDRHGHDIGDAALCAVVERLRNGVRNIDVLGRWGGEEFVALLPAADYEAALLVAQRLRRSVESLLISPSQSRGGIGSAEITTTISLGVTTYSYPTDSIEDLFRRCDSALYQAKAEGRNRVVGIRTLPVFAE